MNCCYSIVVGCFLVFDCFAYGYFVLFRLLLFGLIFFVVCYYVDCLRLVGLRFVVGMVLCCGDVDFVACVVLYLLWLCCVVSCWVVLCGWISV